MPPPVPRADPQRSGINFTFSNRRHHQYQDNCQDNQGQDLRQDHRKDLCYQGVFPEEIIALLMNHESRIRWEGHFLEQLQLIRFS